MRRIRIATVKLLMFMAIAINIMAQNIGGVQINVVSFTVKGFKIGETYSEAMQRRQLKGATIRETDTEFGVDRAFLFEEDESGKNYSYFNFSNDELREFLIQSNRFFLNMGKVQLGLGSSFDKLKDVPQLTLEQAMMGYGANRKPRKGVWVLRHPSLPEDFYYITIYVENEKITAIHGSLVP